jgi:membrane protease YdiL (CAAX protease family)
MHRSGQIILVAMFFAFFAMSYAFVVTNILLLYWISVAVGILTIPVTAALSWQDVSHDFSSSLIYFIMLIASLLVIFFFVSIIDFNWAKFIPGMFVTPVLIEEFNFRYLFQRILLKKISPYIAVFVQSVLYSGYYSRFVISGPGFPFPYNFILISSMLGMGLVYGLLSKLSKNFFLPATLHIALLSILPWLPAAVASTVLPG